MGKRAVGCTPLFKGPFHEVLDYDPEDQKKRNNRKNIGSPQKEEVIIQPVGERGDKEADYDKPLVAGLFRHADEVSHHSRCQGMERDRSDTPEQDRIHRAEGIEQVFEESETEACCNGVHDTVYYLVEHTFPVNKKENHAEFQRFFHQACHDKSPKQQRCSAGKGHAQEGEDVFNYNGW